jgi:hypothetical protein
VKRVRVLRVYARSTPEPGLLRPAIDAALGGRPWPGVEGDVARQVAAAIARERERGTSWR